MFDIGGLEFLLMIVIGIMVIGPKELPNAIRTVTTWIRKARGLAREFQGGLDELVREAELDNVKNELESDFDDLSIENRIQETIDPTGEIGDTFDGDWYSDHADFDVPGDDAAEPEDVAGAAPDDDGSAEDSPDKDDGAGSKA